MHLAVHLHVSIRFIHFFFFFYRRFVSACTRCEITIFVFILTPESQIEIHLVFFVVSLSLVFRRVTVEVHW